MRAYKYRIYPNKETRSKIDKTIEHCRILYNRLIEERKLEYVSTGKSLSRYMQQSTLPERKKYIPAYNNIYSPMFFSRWMPPSSISGGGKRLSLF